MLTPAEGGVRQRRVLGLASYALVAGAVWLAWEVVKAPVADRAPPVLAIRLAPSSPEVLRRTAETEMQAERYENARDLANESLIRAPFNARALRVRGLAEAQLGDRSTADEMLTLAGNWSLRDDPAHAWLVENRLRRGDYGSAFAHADTLARRRPDLYPSLFRLFSTAVLQDQRALPALVSLLGRDPPWRLAFIETMHADPQGAPVVGALALALERTDNPFTTFELQRLYTVWLDAGRLEGIAQVRQALGRPATAVNLQNGDFSTDESDRIQPFDWTLGSAPGIGSTIYEDDLRSGNLAYRLEYDGFGTGVALEQTVTLPPGTYRFTGEQRTETPTDDTRLDWILRCMGTGTETKLGSPAARADTADWARFSFEFTIPAENCAVQKLRLAGRPGGRRTNIALWFDKLAIERVSSRGASTERNQIGQAR